MGQRTRTNRPKRKAVRPALPLFTSEAPTRLYSKPSRPDVETDSFTQNESAAFISTSPAPGPPHRPVSTAKAERSKEKGLRLDMEQEDILSYLENHEEIAGSGQFAAERGLDHDKVVNNRFNSHRFCEIDAI